MRRYSLLWTALLPLLAGIAHGQTPAELAQKLRSKERADRIRAANELGKLGAAAAPAANALASALGDEVPEVRNAAADALGKIGKPAVAHVRNALADSDRYAAAARAAGNLGPLAADLVPALIKCLRVDGIEISDAVEKAIVSIGEPGLPHVIKGLEDHAINSKLCRAVREMGPAAKPAVPALIALVGKRVIARGDAASALGAIGDPQAVPALIDVVDDELPKVAGAKGAVDAMEALGKMKAKPELVIPLCVRVLTSTRRDQAVTGIQDRALRALESFDARTPEALAALRSFLANEPGENKAAAERTLKKLGG